MIIERHETTIIPNTKDGLVLADRHEKMLKEHGIFIERKETTTAILLKSAYSCDFDLEDD